MAENEACRSVFVLRIWQDDHGRVWGQINEPVTGWRRPFTGADLLVPLLLERLRELQTGQEPESSTT